MHEGLPSPQEFPEEPKQDERVVAPLIVEYYRWLESDGREGRGPDDLLSLALPRSQRKLLQERMDDVLIALETAAANTVPMEEARRLFDELREFFCEDKEDPEEE